MAKRKEKRFDWERMWEAVDALYRETMASVPLEGGFTVRDYAERYGLTEAAARMQLVRLCEAGKVRLRGRAKRGRAWVNVYEIPALQERRHGTSKGKKR